MKRGIYHCSKDIEIAKGGRRIPVRQSKSEYTENRILTKPCQTEINSMLPRNDQQPLILFRDMSLT